jgi:hypothetical protein
MGPKQEKKRPERASITSGRGSSKLTIKIEEDTLEVGFVEDLFVFSDAEEKSGAANIVDETGDTFGVVMEVGHKGIREELLGEAGQTKLVFDVSGGFGQVEGRQKIADGDALVEGLVGVESEFGSQIGLTKQDEGQEGIGIEIVVEEEAELVKEVGGQQMGLIDDQERVAMFASQVVEGILELGQQASEGVSGFDVQSEQDLGIESRDIEAGIGQIDEGMEIMVKRMDKSADSSGFTAADIAGDESGQALL